MEADSFFEAANEQNNNKQYLNLMDDVIVTIMAVPLLNKHNYMSAARTKSVVVDL